MDVFILAIAIFLLFEGAMYALLPEQTKKMLTSVLSMDTNNLRIFGLIMVSIGVLLIWIV
jgi:uncharacterized protein YjeT (DUF2065 family)